MKLDPLEEDPLPGSPRLFRDPLTPLVANRGDDLEADEVRVGEGPFREERDGPRGHSPTCPGRADPVAEICETMERVDLAETTATEVGPVARLDGKMELGACFELPDLVVNPVLGFGDLVVRMAPGKPREDLGHGFACGFEEKRHVRLVIGTQSDSGHFSRHSFGETREGLRRSQPAVYSLDR